MFVLVKWVIVNFIGIGFCLYLVLVFWFVKGEEIVLGGFGDVFVIVFVIWLILLVFVVVNFVMFYLIIWCVYEKWMVFVVWIVIILFWIVVVLIDYG